MKTAAKRDTAAEAPTAQARNGASASLAPRPYGVAFADGGLGLLVGQTTDPAEQEADAMAEQALSGIPPARPRGGAIAVRRMCAQCEEDDKDIIIRRQPAGVGGAGGMRAPEPVTRLMSQPGRQLDAATRSYFEGRFQRSFAHVGIHDGLAADEAAHSIGARAFTLGSTIAFARGEHAPGTDSGRRLLAHELAHVVQNAQSHADPQVRRSPDYAKLTIDQLRKLLNQKDKGAALELGRRYDAMSNLELARHALGDEIAATTYAARVVPPTAATNQGSFSNKGVHDTLAADIKADRSASGITRHGPSAVEPNIKLEGGTVGAARTDVPGLEGRPFTGRSPVAGGAFNPASEFPPATSYGELPHTHAHAEQQIADALDEALKKVPREQLAGRRVWMLIEQEPCSTCAAGARGTNVAAGVLKKLSLKYPEIIFEIKSLESSSIIVLKGGAPAGAAAAGSATGTSGKSVQVDTKIEVTKSVRTPEGTTISEVEYAFGKGLEEVNANAPKGAEVPSKVVVKITQNADGTIAAVESLSGQPKAMVEAIAHRTLSGGATEGAAVAKAAGGGVAAGSARTALLFKGLKIGGNAAFAIITAYQLWNATPKERPRVLAGAAAGFAGGLLATYVACNVVLGIETLGWSLLICGLIAGGAGGYAGTKGGEAIYDAATATELDEALRLLAGKSQNQIGIFNFLVTRIASDGCIDAQFVRDFIAIIPAINDTESVLIAAQLADAPIHPVPPAKKVAPKSFPAYGSFERDAICPGCHGRPTKDLVPPTMSPAELEALKAMPVCSTVKAEALTALREAVKRLPPRKTPLKPKAVPGPFDHSPPAGIVGPSQKSTSFPSEKEQLGTVCPNCHAPNKGPSLWKEFGPLAGDQPGSQISDMDRERIRAWIQAQAK